MRIKLIDCDFAPTDMEGQIPIYCKTIRKIPGKDRPDYWLVKCKKPVKYNGNNIHYLILAARFAGQTIKIGMGTIAVGVAYVIDESLTNDNYLDFNKINYVAICTAKECKLF